MGFSQSKSKAHHSARRGGLKDQSDVIPPKKESEPKRFKPNDDAHQQTLNKIFKPTKETVGTVTIGYDPNTNREERRLCDGCGTIHSNPRTEANCNGCYFFRQKHPDFNYEKVSWKDSAIGKAYAKVGADGLKGSKILREGKLVDRLQQQKRDKGTSNDTY